MLSYTVNCVVFIQTYSAQSCQTRVSQVLVYAALKVHSVASNIRQSTCNYVSESLAVSMRMDSSYDGGHVVW